LDINFTSPRAGYASVVSGTGAGGTDGEAAIKGAVSHSQASASDAWVVQHNLDWLWPNVTVYDDSNQALIPQTITSVTANRVTIDFDSPVQGYAGISSGGGNAGPTGSRGAAGLGWFDGTTYISASDGIDVNVSGTLNVTASDSTIAATFDGNVSGSSSSTGSFGSIYTDKNVNATAFFGTVGAGATLGGVTMDVGGTDADGDIYYRSSNVLTRLAKGNDNDTLMMNGSVPNWEAVAAFDATSVASDVKPDGDNTRNLGAADKRWANVHTADMHLDNINGIPNEIDGTEGSWTIQEGEDKLYLLNNKSGKKYSFVLKEEN
jgi:hypothetical protein